MGAGTYSYTYYKDALAGRSMPCAFVDVDLLDENIAALRERAGSKTIRVASKSVRCPWVLKRILASDPAYQGIMSFTAREAAFLSGEGFDDILMGYPVWHEGDVQAVCDELRKGKTVIFMIDAPEHVLHLDAIAEREGVTIPVCIDVDMSTEFPGVYFGVRRSGITAPEHVRPVLDALEEASNVTLKAIMGYEAQIAGVPDSMPSNAAKNLLIRQFKKRSIKEIAQRRAALVEAVRARGFKPEVINGGGTGSLESTRAEEHVTEVTVGSGFFSPHQFDYYTGFKHRPAAGYLIEIVRIPKPGIYTCAGGGYVASGAAGRDKLPQPYLPEGASLLTLEGAGEVQTPIEYSGPETLGLGDPILMRHSKAGELCERFNTVLLISDGKIIDEVPTYRGLGQCFL